MPSSEEMTGFSNEQQILSNIYCKTQNYNHQQQFLFLESMFTNGILNELNELRVKC